MEPGNLLPDRGRRQLRRNRGASQASQVPPVFGSSLRRQGRPPRLREPESCSHSTGAEPWRHRSLPRIKPVHACHATGVKVAVSIPDDLFERAERLRRRECRSRSHVYAAALARYVACHAPGEVTESLGRVCTEVNPDPDDFIRAASTRILEQSEW